MAGLLEGRTIVVTGASRGIGRAIALTCAREGAVVGVNYLQQSAKAEEVCHEIYERYQRQAWLLPFDVRDMNAVAAACASWFAAGRVIDGWVNNAAVNRPGLLLTQTDESIREQLETNLNGPLNCLRAVLPHFLERRGGAVVNVGSVSARRPSQGQAVYAASKGGLTALTRALAVEYGRKQIRVNCIEPGPVESDMLQSTATLAGDEIRRHVPLGRFGQPAEIAELAAFLLSNRAEFLTGGIFSADGGYSLG